VTLNFVLRCSQAFLRLSRTQKDSLAALYGAYLQQEEALRRECLATSFRLEVASKLFPATTLITP